MAPKTVTIWIGEGPDHKGKRHKSFPYVGTGVGLNQSIGLIKDLLERFDCEKIVDFSEKCKDQPHSSRVIGFEKDGLRYLVEFPIVYVENRAGKNLNMDVSGRIVYNRVKALLVDAEIEYLSFHEAMIPYLALPTPDGGVVSVMELVQTHLPEIRKGTSGLFQLTSGGS